jgi:MATE family, multidrug efflux pump
MEHRISLIPLAVIPSAPARPIASRTKMPLEAPILPTLLRLSAPNVLNLKALVGKITFDAIFVSRLGADPLAGVSLVLPWVMFMQHAANSGMGGAVSSAIARALGAGERDRANTLASHGLAFAFAMAAVTSAFMLLCGSFLYQLMGGQGAVLTSALAYSNVVFCVYGFHVGCKKAIALRDAGFDAKYMKGGHSAWKAIGGPTKMYV